jgi:asparagine synthase (glutamine-hydrolysing)
MCGVAGFYGRRIRTDEDARSIASRMGAALVHRGPDDGGVWVDGAAGIALAFRRLSIVDLSAEGHQPMCSASGRFTIIFNGEV